MDRRDEVGFDEFYTDSWGRLFAQAYVLTGDRETAKDLTQEALVRAWRRWDRIAGYESPEGWTRRVLHNLCIESWRRTTVRNAAMQPPTPTESPDIPVHHHELAQAMRTLPGPAGPCAAPPRRPRPDRAGDGGRARRPRGNRAFVAEPVPQDRRHPHRTVRPPTDPEVLTMPEPIDDGGVASVLRDALAAAARTSPPETPAELRARSGRRAHRTPDLTLIVAVAAAVVLVVALVTVGLVHRSARGPDRVTSGGHHSFSIRPVLCYAAPYDPSSAASTVPGQIPTCAPADALTAANLAVTPMANSSGGFTSNLASIGVDDALAGVRSTPTGQVTPGATVLLPGAPGAGPVRYALGPAGVTGADVATATVTREAGQVTIDLRLTPSGAVRWDALAHRQFHALVGVVVDGRVVSAPVNQPTQSTFTSFHGSVQLAGGFTESQAHEIASWIPGSR